MIDEISLHRSQQARKFVGYAMRHNPTRLYEMMDAPEPKYLGFLTSKRIVALGHDDKQYEYILQSDADATHLLWNAIEDTQSVIESAFDASHPPSEATALAIIRHPETIRTFAMIALRKEEKTKDSDGHYLPDVTTMDFLTKERRLQTDVSLQAYRIDDTMTHLAANLQLLALTREGGCPFAGKNGEIDIDPLFKRFVPWAGELVLRSLYTHEYNNTTTAIS